MNSTQGLKNKRILVAEDDASLRQVICKILQAEGSWVEMAENGLIAKNLLDKNEGNYDLLLSDVRMPELDGVELLKYTKGAFPRIRVLIFTGFSEILESQQAFELGANAFLAKPFRLTDLKKALLEVFNDNKSHGTQEEVLLASAYSFCRIRVEEFISTSRLASDLYVRVAKDRFVKIAREGTQIQVDRIQTYKEKKVDYFYVRAEDFQKYTGLNLKIAHVVATRDNLTNEQKLKLYQHTTEVVVQQIMMSGMQKDLTDAADSLVNNTLGMVASNPDLLELLLMMQSRGDALYNHCWAVATYSCLIANKMGWTSPQNQYKLSVAGLFHDLGLKELPPELVEKPRHKMTADEVQLYETHPTRGRDILSAVPGFPGDLALIVFQHHETLTGTGYPMRSTSLKIHPLAKVLRVAEEFCDRALVNGRCRNVSDAADILKELNEAKAGDFEPEILGALFDLFEQPRPVNLKKGKKLSA